MRWGGGDDGKRERGSEGGIEALMFYGSFAIVGEGHLASSTDHRAIGQTDRGEERRGEEEKEDSVDLGTPMDPALKPLINLRSGCSVLLPSPQICTKTRTPFE